MPKVFSCDLLVFMDTKRSAHGTASGINPELGTGAAEERHLLYWPTTSGAPHPKHYLAAIDAHPHVEDGRGVYFMTLDTAREHAAREQFAHALGARLRSLRADRSRPEVAAYLGRHPNTIAKFERGDALPDAWELERLSRLYEITIQELFDLAGLLPAVSDDIGSEFVMVPEYAVRASAGSGALVASEDVVGRFAFRKAWLDSRGIRPENLAVVSADGDSMEPTVRDGDILLVDTSVQGVRADGIYLIEQAGELRCKRLQAMVDGGVRIRSDNAKYDTEVVSSDHADLLRVVAKVIWIGGER